MALLLAPDALCWLLVCGAAAYLLLAIGSVIAFRPPKPPAPIVSTPVTVLRPLCGDEQGLEAGLQSLLSQEVDNSRFRFVFGVASAGDAALPIARAVAARFPDRRIAFVLDAATHGANPKVSNLINMAQGGLDPLVVISDSDVVLPPGSLKALVDAASPDDVGAVTALSRGRPGDRSSFAQRLGALYLDGWFLPTALLHARLAPAAVCYGQLTAIKREVLDHGGGFEAIADSLADDTELGHLTRRAGRRIVFAPHVVDVWVNDADLKSLFRHELRWARTIRALQPRGYVASIFMHPGPLPLLLTVIDPGLRAWGAVIGLTLLRYALVWTVKARFGRTESLRGADIFTVWIREQLYFIVWIAGFFGRKINWRGRELQVGPNATVEAPARGLGAEAYVRET